jgi:fatty-acyl-CoA synthase
MGIDLHRNTSVGSWIARRARRSPDRIALIHGSRSLTYWDLHLRVARLAHFLASRGIEKGDRVAILGENDPAHVELLFACGLLGAIWVPVHPRFPVSAQASVLRQAQCKAVFFTPDLADRIDLLRDVLSIPLAIGIHDCEEERSRMPAKTIDEPIGLEDPAVLAFTSGTTSDNKGIVLSHGNLAFNVFNLLSAVDFVSDDVLLATAPLYRMGGLGFVLPVLFKGGTCVLSENRDPEATLALAQRHRASLMFDGPSVAQAMLESPALDATDLSALRVFMCGGDAPAPSLVEGWLRRGVCLVQGYGLTEASPVALLLDPVDAETRVGSVGRPPLLCSVRIVDENLEHVRPGQVGELLVHGPNVMRGYWRRPGATARALTEDGWLRTGDAAAMDERGDVTIVGRVADRMRVGNAILYPQSIEEVLGRHPTVAQCAVMQEEGSDDLTAVVVPARAGSFDPDDLLRHARAALPVERVPRRVRVASHLPRNATGKLLRHRLGTEHPCRPAS